MSLLQRPHAVAREKARIAEERGAAVRVAVVAFLAVVYAAMDRTGTHEVLAWTIVGVAAAYSLAMWIAKPYRRFSVLLSSYTAAASDSGLILLWLYATGGYDSPFYVLWYVSIAGMAFRFDFEETMLWAAIYALAYFTLCAAMFQVEGNGVALTVRAVFILFVAAEAGLISREQLREAHARAEALHEIDAFKTGFMRMAAHDLRTPLTPIKAHLHILKKDRGEAASPREMESLLALERSVQRMGRLVDDLLDASRAQGGALVATRERVDLADVGREAAAAFGATAAERGIALDARLEGEAVVVGDPERLAQVYFNLVGNALKFTRAGGRVVLEVARDGGEAVLRVADTGVGLSAEDAAQLFQPFSRVDNPMSRREAGTGLGLYITRAVVEAHGGRISVASEGPGRGSTFTVRVPLADRA